VDECLFVDGIRVETQCCYCGQPVECPGSYAFAAVRGTFLKDDVAVEVFAVTIPGGKCLVHKNCRIGAIRQGLLITSQK
jgi:hypothetical protein